ncbi:MAG: MerC domain-containing protein [Proteobacteria bacterium]|nr:MAG: MerC domain-containing protein [Pseudomonadota bacterium]
MLDIVKTEELANNKNPKKAVDKLDRAGATASFLCAIHCALMPLIVTLLPLFGLSFLASEPVEWALLLLSAGFGTASICLGFKEHRSRKVFAVLGVGIMLLVAGRIFHHIPFGGAELVDAHGHAHGHDHVHSIEVNQAGMVTFGPSVILMVLGGFTMMGAHIFNQMLCHRCRKCNENEDDCHI